MSLDHHLRNRGAARAQGWDGLGMAVQAYGKRCARTSPGPMRVVRRRNRRIAVRLVKGAYWTPRSANAGKGLADYPVFTRKPPRRIYLACAKDMLVAANIYPAFATHNALTVATCRMAGERPTSNSSGCTGWAARAYEPLVRDQGYIPAYYARAAVIAIACNLVGACSKTAPIRASSTARRRVDDRRPILADPVAKIVAVGGTRHPSIPLPEDLFAPERKNSSGLELDRKPELERVAAVVAGPLEWQSAVTSSGEHPEACRAAARDAVGRALAAFPDWTSQSIDNRAACLDRLADLLERDRDNLMRIAVQEARKTIPDALAEVREAVDFCRYYAAQARSGLKPIELPGPTGERNVLRMEGRGVFVCIAPWNFPLAIFCGQVAAALVTGNTVVAKPARRHQIAAYAVGLAHGAGISRKTR